MATTAEDERRRQRSTVQTRARRPRDPGIGSPTPRQMLERSRTFAALALALDYMLERAGIGGIGLFEP